MSVVALGLLRLLELHGGSAAEVGMLFINSTMNYGSRPGSGLASPSLFGAVHAHTVASCHLMAAFTSSPMNTAVLHLPLLHLPQHYLAALPSSSGHHASTTALG